MKPVDTAAAATAPPNDKGTGNVQPAEKTDELRAAIEQRLWQLLLALPDIQLDGIQGIPDLMLPVSEISGTQALDATSGSTQGDVRRRDERDKDASGLLTSAAHMLAMTIPQLGLLRYSAADSGDAGPQPSAAAQQPNWTVQLGRVDADGGSAALNVLHPLLGDIALDIELSQSSVRVIATVPTDYGARILLEGQQVLAERLLRQGVTLEVMDVLVRRKRKSKETKPARRRPRKEDR